MKTNEMTRKASLKTKVTLAVASLFILFVTMTSFFTLWYFESTFKKSITQQQFTFATSLANDIEDKLRIAHQGLKAVAKTAPGDVFSNADSAQRFLDRQTGLLSIFDNGVFFINREGILIAESPYRPGRRGKDLSFREWVQKTVTRATHYISDPYISTHSPGQPAIVMTAPIFDNQGNLLGMMTGSLDLTKKNFLANLSRLKIGQNGYVLLFDSNRTMIVHPDPHRIMQPIAPPGVNKLADKAFNGFEGSGETVTSYGIPMLTSFKRLPVTSWVLGINYPISEAYAPIYRVRYYLGIAIVVATSVLLTITWFITKRILTPLAVMTGHVEHLAEKPPEERQIQIESLDEIGVLAKAFNAMVDGLDQQQELLKKRIALAVDELRKKDQVMIIQNRQAAMGEMIGNIAHQWRQPLNALVLLLANIKDAHDHNQLDAKYMEEALADGNRLVQKMSMTINDFRNFFRPDKEKVPFSAQRQISEAISLVESSFRNEQIAIFFNPQDDLILFGYPNEYSQVLLNLLSNAKEAIMTSGVTPGTVEIQLARSNRYGRVTISDNGGGIAPEIMDKIFDPYFSSKATGTGIGLYMSKMIIERNMDSFIDVCNIEGGACFSIITPLAECGTEEY